MNNFLINRVDVDFQSTVATMGSWASRNNSANSAQEKKNQEIDNQLLQEKRESLLSPKLLLLGENFVSK